MRVRRLVGVVVVAVLAAALPASAGATGVPRLAFYDWEANALVQPTGSKPGAPAQTVASLLSAQDKNAIKVSQGIADRVPPGSAAAGTLPFYQAVKLASQQPYSPSVRNSQEGNLVYLFGAPRSAACAAAKATNTRPGNDPCLLTQPVAVRNGLSPARARHIAERALTKVARRGARMLIVKQGTIVLQAVPNIWALRPAYGSPTAGYFVLRDDAALLGNEITKPVARADQTGTPDVQWGFTRQGVAQFQQLTSRIAHRGSKLSARFPAGSQPDQHFAVVLGKQLISIPSVDFQQFPNGIIGSKGFSVTGNFSSQSAAALARQLRASMTCPSPAAVAPGSAAARRCGAPAQ